MERMKCGFALICAVTEKTAEEIVPGKWFAVPYWVIDHIRKSLGISNNSMTGAERCSTLHEG